MKGLYKILFFLLVCILTTVFLSGGIWAEELSEGNNDSNTNTDLRLSDQLIVDSEEIQITATDGEYNYTMADGGVRIVDYLGAGGDVVIPKTLGGNPVTSIGCLAFYDHDSLTSVIIPEGVTIIREGAFENCNSLSHVSMPDSLITIDNQAFDHCRSLKNVSIPDGVTSIGEAAFYYCSSLENVTIPDSVTIIEEYAFTSCALMNVIIPDSVTEIGYSVFCGNGLKTIQLNSPTTKINYSINSTIPSCATIIGYDPSTAKDYAKFYGNPFKVIDSDNSETRDIAYATHIQNYGWQNLVSDGVMSGTLGAGLRLEGIKISTGIEGLGVSYSTHVENIGWQESFSDGAISGTSGKGLRLEAIRINLTGERAEKYDVYYRVHAQNFGWLDWAKNGESAGTAGFGYRLEAISIKVVPKDAAAPGTKDRPFVQK